MEVKTPTGGSTGRAAIQQQAVLALSQGAMTTTVDNLKCNAVRPTVLIEFLNFSSPKTGLL